MKVLFLTFYIFFLLLPHSSLGQDGDTAATEDTAEELTEETLDESQEEEKANQVVQPKRLPGSLPRPSVPRNEDSNMRIMAQHFPKDSLYWLETDTEEFLSIWQKDRSGDPKGALLIIHGEGEHPISSKTIMPLHETLPDHGWMTLAISIPSPDQRKTPPRDFPVKARPTVTSDTKTDDESETSANEAMDDKPQTPEPSPTSPTQNIQAFPAVTSESELSAEAITDKRLESALRFLHDKGQFNVIILGSGTGAIIAQEFIEKITPRIDNPRLKKNIEKPIRALVLLNGRNNLPTRDEAFTKWFFDPDIPVLDIFMQTDLRNKSSAKLRKTIARQKKVKIYKQVRLVEMNFEKSWKSNNLSQRVLGFLDSYAAGIEVNNAILRRYR